LINISKKRSILIIVVFLILSLCLGYYIYFERDKSYQSITMFMYIENKEHHIEPGKYLEMWVIGSNGSDSSQNKNKMKYKVMIKDSRIYNLLEEGNEYFVSLEGIKKKTQSDYTYTFGHIGLLDGTKLSGEGIID
jgi:hypothetical protein